MTLRTLMSEATTLAGNRSDIAISTVSLQVNLAQLEVAAMAPHGALESTATLAVPADSNTTTLPADFAEPIAVSRVSSYDNFAYRLLTEVGIGQIDNASEGTTAGTPNRYAVYNGALFFYPTPSSADSLILRYRRVPADMTERGLIERQVVDLVSEWHDGDRVGEAFIVVPYDLPRGNAATYTKAWDHLRKLYAAEPAAQRAELTASSAHSRAPSKSPWNILPTASTLRSMACCARSSSATVSSGRRDSR